MCCVFYIILPKKQKQKKNLSKSHTNIFSSKTRFESYISITYLRITIRYSLWNRMIHIFILVSFVGYTKHCVLYTNILYSAQHQNKQWFNLFQWIVLSATRRIRKKETQTNFLLFFAVLICFQEKHNINSFCY